MTNDSLVSINIYNKKTKELYNDNLVPILFYWNGKGEIIDNIIKSNYFKDKYLNNINDYEKFINLQLSFFYFKLNQDTNEEEYYDTTIDICEYFSFEDFNSEVIIWKLVIPYFYSLYKMVFKEEYDHIKVFNQDIIIEIYRKIKDKYKSKIEKQTLLNWIRSELINNDKINSKNINFIINKLNNILQNES